MSDMTTITRIKRKPDGSLMEITAELELANQRGVKATHLKCSDEPMPSFSKALDALEHNVRAILEIAPEQWDEALTITGVSFSGKDDETVVITAQVELAASESGLVLNTPSMPVADLAPEMQTAVQAVREQAQAYLDGKRKGDLFAKAA